MASSHDAPVILMCPPTYFTLTAPDPQHGFANDMIAEAYAGFQKDPAAFQALAQVQWDKLKNTFLEKLGAEVILIQPHAELQDQVFTADASLSVDNLTLISKMTHPLRGGETVFHQEAIQNFDQNRKFIHNDIPSEGTGDNLYDPFRDCFWSGFTPDPCHSKAAEGRSDIRSHAHLAEQTKRKVISMEVKRPFFHIDTAFAALPRGHVLYYPRGMSPEAVSKIKEEGISAFGLATTDYMIEVTEEEAYSYACNLVYYDNKIVLPECGERLPRLLEALGYEVFTVDLSCFIQAGGGPHCLTNKLNL